MGITFSDRSDVRTAAATVLDVARQAGVSSATVSRVLNGNPTVSQEMRDRVRSAVRDMEFRPNPMAQGLRKGQANTVALLVGDIAQRHFAELTMRIQIALEQEGIDLLLIDLAHSAKRLKDFLARAASMRLRGVVVALSDDVPKSIGPLFTDLRAAAIRVVSIGQDLRRLGIASIVHEERAAAQRSVEYLLEKGHRRIAYVGRIKGSAVGAERFKGYQAAMKKAGMFSDELVWDMSFRYAAGHDAVVRASERRLMYTAIQAGSDEIATGAMAALHDRGLRVPADVAVIGFGDVEMGAYLRPALSTVSTHPELVAEHLSQLLTAPSERQSVPSLTLLCRTLVTRESA